MIRLLPFLREYRKESIIGPLFKLLEAALELIVPLIMAQIIDVGIRRRNVPYIWKMGILLAVLGLMGLSCSLLAQYFAAKAAVGFGTKLRHSMFAHIGTLSYEEVDKAGDTALVVRMTSDINQVQSGVNLVLRLFLRSPFIVVGAVLMAFTIDSRMAVIFAIAVPALSLVIYGIMLLTIPLYKKVQRALEQVLLLTRENLEGIRVIRAFRTQDREKGEYGEKSSILMGLQLRVGRISALLNPLTYVCVNLGIVAVVWYGGSAVNTGRITQGEVIALANYMTQILAALAALANLIVAFTRSVACAGRINETLALQTGIVGGDKTEGRYGEAIPLVEMRGVSFSYYGSSKPAIDNISFCAEKGETVGVIGGTGSGKTTLINLIPRFYEATAGCVLIDGVDVKQWNLEALRRLIGVVPQKAVLFYGTIRENMQMGQAEAGDREIEEALKAAQVFETAEREPRGLDAIISEGGRNLSGGQRQRFTIARALLKKPQILILDDSTSALDYATERRLRKALLKEAAKRIVFIVSQRVASIRHADKIIVLDDGKLTAVGTHEELIGNCSVYQEICASQLPKEEVR